MSLVFLRSLRRSLLLMLWMAAAAGAAPVAETVDVNSADAIELAARLSGVGMSRAEAIIHYRETQGRFEHPDDLVRVKGIGPKTLDKNRKRIRIDPPVDTAQP